MKLDKGKYGHIAEELQKQHEAEGVMVLIYKQDDDSGLSIAGTAMFHAMLPKILSAITADCIISHKANMESILGEMLKDIAEKN